MTAADREDAFFTSEAIAVRITPGRNPKTSQPCLLLYVRLMSEGGPSDGPEVGFRLTPGLAGELAYELLYRSHALGRPLA